MTIMSCSMFDLISQKHGRKATCSNDGVVFFGGILFSIQFLAGEPQSEQQWAVLRRDIKRLRNRSMDISWFTRIVNESIARQANKEDKCTGRFWEERFKSQTLLDERTLLSCMAYVDLNPIRAKMVNSREESDHYALTAKREIIH